MDVSGISLPSVPWCEYWYILELEVSSSAFFSPPYLVILLTPTQLWLILYSDSLLVILQAILPSVFIDLIHLSCSLSLLNVFFLISYCFMLYFQEITEQCSVLPPCPDSWMLQVLLRSKSKTSFITSFWLAKGEEGEVANSRIDRKSIEWVWVRTLYWRICCRSWVQYCEI